jgi:hypothetical protein
MNFWREKILIFFLEEKQTNVSMFSYNNLSNHDFTLKPNKTLVESCSWAQMMTIANPVKDRIFQNLDGLGIAVGGKRGTGSILAKKNALYLLDLEGEEEPPAAEEAPQEEQQNDEEMTDINTEE